ncbi:hypothetical protein I4U23_029613 [Adineta vaga]|nr:hypothetical protein I4U23_029613 [Adineta vaga]
MYVWYFIGLIGCFYVDISYGQNPPSALTDRESRQNDIAQIPGVILDNPPPIFPENTNTVVDAEVVTETISSEATTTLATTTQTSEPFLCYECTDCQNKSALLTTVCGGDIGVCYSMTKRVNNISQIIRRGCTTSKDQCMIPTDDQPHTYETVTCCKHHKCNQATEFSPMFFLFILSLFIILINHIHV